MKFGKMETDITPAVAAEQVWGSLYENRLAFEAERLVWLRAFQLGAKWADARNDHFARRSFRDYAEDPESTPSLDLELTG